MIDSFIILVFFNIEISKIKEFTLHRFVDTGNDVRGLKNKTERRRKNHEKDEVDKRGRRNKTEEQGRGRDTVRR
jgi:hypothetical protein